MLLQDDVDKAAFGWRIWMVGATLEAKEDEALISVNLNFNKNPVQIREIF